MKDTSLDHHLRLELLKQQAQATANRSGFPVAIYNFNKYSPVYVLRDFGPGDEARNGYVLHVTPE